MSHLLKNILFGVFCFLVSTTAALGQGNTTSLGLNKTELLQQYLGTASSGDGSAAYRKLTQAMARKAMDDAQDIGATFFRVAITGTHPVTRGRAGDLDLWLKDPQSYWALVDQMMADLTRRNQKIVPVFVWSTAQIPNMVNETVVDFLRSDKSRSWELLEKYVREFVTRYREKDVILFYELTNELTNSADVNVEASCDNGARKLICGAAENHTTADVIAFSGRLAKLIKSLDGSRMISSGFAVPRPSAYNLRLHPAWSGERASWKEDTVAQMENYLRDTHRHVDIISVHLYPNEKNRRFGIKQDEEYKLLAIIKAAADRIGKPLFVGEFGDFDTARAGTDSFTSRMLDELVGLKVAYAAPWGWEFYLKNPYTLQVNKRESGKDNIVALEPGMTDFLLQRYKQASAMTGRKMQPNATKDVYPPRVILTWPIECSKVSDAQALYAVASDGESRVERVDFMVGGEVVSTKTAPPYQGSWNARGKKSGEYTFTARAVDSFGNKKEYSTVVLVNTQKTEGPVCTEGRQ